ncbi:hypothetical protein QVD17_25537 [Tagetes erecta]|uniref:Uncharacterized protein n=1 Tax=Tagetes erecta TaxID=13708 RepID=A0AAD8KLB5_TARER|nr:hypothetical protein QVD17_25537 [Tagetes erecta]
MAHDSIYTDENNAKELALVARHRFNEGTLKELIDPRIIEEDDEHLVTLNRGPNQKSFDAFSTIACQCLAETQAKRPRIETIIKELQNALNLQGETMILTRFRLTNEEASAKVYWSPEFQETRIMKTESDIYSLGVILFEIFCGKLAYDHSYIADNEKGLAPIARGYFNDGSIRNLIDPKLKEASDDDIFTSNKGINQDSLDAFLKIAYQCLGEAKARPTTEIIIKELETALNFQKFVTTISAKNGILRLSFH